MKFLGLVVLVLTPLCASTITSVSTSNGTPYTVTYDSFTATEANMAGRLSIVAEFGVGGISGTPSCSWVDGPPNCESAGNFRVNFSNGANTYNPIDDGFWTITNLNSTFALTAITFYGVNGPGNGVAFDRCMSGPGTFNDTNSSGNCGTNGTVGSDNGWSADTRSGSGTANISAAASYSNILKIAANPAVGDAYGVLRLVFGGSQSFNQNHTFTFEADTDLVNNAQTGIPEPGSLVLLGSGLIGLAALARRRRKQ